MVEIEVPVDHGRGGRARTCDRGAHEPSDRRADTIGPDRDLPSGLGCVPARASSSAVAAPATRAPTTTASCFVTGGIVVGLAGSGAAPLLREGSDIGDQQVVTSIDTGTPFVSTS